MNFTHTIDFQFSGSSCHNDLLITPMMKKLDHDDLLFKVNNPYTEGLKDEPKGERFEVIRAPSQYKDRLIYVW